MRTTTRCAAVLGVMLGGLTSSANASTLLYTDTTAPGSSAFISAGATLANYPFTLVTSFTVNVSGLYLFGLGVYDYNKGTISAGVDVGLFNDTTNTAVTTLSMGGTAYDGTGGSMFTTKSLATPIALISGDTYSLESWGWPSSPNTIGETLGRLTTFNTLGGDLTNVVGGTGGSASKGQSASNINIVPQGSNTAPANGICELTNGCTAASGNNRYNGGTDYLADQTALIGTPLPATWTMLIAGFAGLGFFAYRGSRNGSVAVAAV
jgi:hypothetical protein